MGEEPSTAPHPLLWGLEPRQGLLPGAQRGGALIMASSVGAGPSRFVTSGPRHNSGRMWVRRPSLLFSLLCFKPGGECGHLGSGASGLPVPCEASRVLTVGYGQQALGGKVSRQQAGHGGLCAVWELGPNTAGNVRMPF